MICIKCYHLNSCHRKPSLDDRCMYYLKKGIVRLDNGIDAIVNPLNTREIDFEEIRRCYEVSMKGRYKWPTLTSL